MTHQLWVTNATLCQHGHTFQKEDSVFLHGNANELYIFNSQALLLLHSYFSLFPGGIGFSFLKSEAGFIVGCVLSLNAQNPLECLQSDVVRGV